VDRTIGWVAVATLGEIEQLIAGKKPAGVFDEYPQ
jgi:hypothetical protein